MKSLRQYLIEESDKSSVESKTFIFDFTGLDNAEDTLKSLDEYDCISVDGNKATLTISNDVSYDSALDVLQQTVSTYRKSQNSINNEQYAQKTKKLQTTLSSVYDFIDELNEPEDSDENSDKDSKDDNKEDE